MSKLIDIDRLYLFKKAPKTDCFLEEEEVI